MNAIAATFQTHAPQAHASQAHAHMHDGALWSPAFGDHGFASRIEAKDVHGLAAKLAEAEDTIAEQRERIAYLETLTQTDELTGLVNRRGFNVELRRALAAARRTGGGGVLVMIDLDGFKAINDTHGHLAGDAYLRQVARFLQTNVRGCDVVARLGGDEFAVLLADSDAETGTARAAQLAQAANNAIADYQGTPLAIRLSTGVQTFTGADQEEDVLRQADVKMYRNKSERRGARARARA